MNRPVIDPRIKASFDRQGMMHRLEARLVEADKGRCVIRAPLLAGFIQQQGFAHGGVSFTLGDTAAGYAALTMVPPGQEVLTAEMKINYLAPIINAEIEAVGEVLRAGRRLLVVRAELFALRGEERRSAALMLGTMTPVDLP